MKIPRYVIVDDVKILPEAIAVFVLRVMSSTVGPGDAKVGDKQL